MAGMFDWLKRGKSVRRRRSSGKRSDTGKHSGVSQDRDPASFTEFIGKPLPADGAPHASQHAPPPPVPSAAPVPGPAPGGALAPPPASQPAKPLPTPRTPDSNATQYHPVGPTSSGLVAVLIVKEGLARDQIYRVYDGENSMGRGKSAKIRVDSADSSISRLHAMIIHEFGSFGIKPLKEGKNPTFVNEVEVTGGGMLVDGDLIRIGNTTLRFKVT